MWDDYTAGADDHGELRIAMNELPLFCPLCLRGKNLVRLRWGADRHRCAGSDAGGCGCWMGPRVTLELCGLIP